MHFYPPFLFTKCYLDISRRATFHFDSPSLTWKPGKYFSIFDIFSNIEGKLRIGIHYKIESFFDSILWFIFLIILSCFIIAYNELRNNMKLDDKSSFFLYEIYKTLKTAVNLFRLKYTNLKREKLEGEVNKVYGKFMKNYEFSQSRNKRRGSTNSNLSNNASGNSDNIVNNFEIHDCKLFFLNKRINIKFKLKKIVCKNFKILRKFK